MVKRQQSFSNRDPPPGAPLNRVLLNSDDDIEAKWRTLKRHFAEDIRSAGQALVT
jgi:hypothetical protein